jgi:hypothetical protein
VLAERDVTRTAQLYLDGSQAMKRLLMTGVRTIAPAARS